MSDTDSTRKPSSAEVGTGSFVPVPGTKIGASRWRAVCAYDGGMFHGWQSQANARAVQDVIEAALEGVLGVKTRILGSGRTDTGVHALAQVFHFDAAWPHAPERLVRALHTKLPPGVRVKSIRRAPSGFHARFDATGKRYHYRLYLGHAGPFEARWCWSCPHALDFAAMKAGAEVLRGRRDFAAFCALNRDAPESTVRDLRRLDLRHRGPRMKIVLEADGFLYKMARSLVGTLVNLGRGALTVRDIHTFLESGRRSPMIVTAPAHGLFLERVFYEPGR